ncbi:MAG: AI-2E family transporter [Desulfobacterales bacterium S3730MH5]|nr:MAG: AI-2E family transporter [Desulfobacterales bacterium S3730MH5]
MKNADSAVNKRNFLGDSLEAAIRIGLIALLVWWCFLIFRPFLIPVLWAIIIADAVYPFYRKLENGLGGRSKLTAVLFTLAALSLLMVPTVMLFGSLIDSVKELSAGLKNGALTIPPPTDSVATWPVIGESVHKFWHSASVNLQATLLRIGPQLKGIAGGLMSSGAGLVLGVLQFVISIMIAGVFLAKAEDCHNISIKIFRSATGEKGAELVNLSSATIRSVAQGVLGVAIIQSLLAGVGMLIVGVPGAGFWALLVLLLAVVQLPPILVLGPVIFYVFSVSSSTAAVIFAIWGVFVSISDSFLKPLLLGRGVQIPMLVILIGAIGGMMLSGIIGLFVGAVVLSLGFKLFQAWLDKEAQPEPATMVPDPSSVGKSDEKR